MNDKNNLFLLKPLMSGKFVKTIVIKLHHFNQSA